MGKAYDDVLCEFLVDLEELAVVNYAGDDGVHVICLVWIVRDYAVEGIVNPVYGVCRGFFRGCFQVVLGDEAQELLYGLDAFLLILRSEVGYAALGCVDGCSAKFLLGDFLSGYALGAGEEHVGGILYHEGEVRKGGGIHRAACAGTENAANLRDHAGGKDISLENLSEASKGVYSFLDAGSAGIVKAYTGGSVTYCQVHDLADLFAHGL